MRLYAFSLVLAVSIAGCSLNAEREISEQDQAIFDYIALHELESIDGLRSGRTDSWSSITEQFIVYEGRNKEPYLVKFKRDCYELDDDKNIVADVRWDSNTLRARFDTIRGCHIDSIYALSDAEAIELKELGASFEGRN